MTATSDSNKQVKTPILKVYPIKKSDGTTTHVRAPNPSAALLHVHKTDVGAALNAQAVDALHVAGVKIETAG